MKNYKKVQMVAKNAPTGSYAAGCPTDKGGGGYDNTAAQCAKCDRVR